MIVRHPGRGLLAAALALSACDSFDFGRVTGTAPGTSASSATGASASSTTAASASSTTTAKKPARFVISLGGDLSLGGGVKAWGEANEKRDPLAGLRPVFEGTILAVASLVSPITARPGSPARSTIPSAPPAAALALARTGLHLVDATSEGLLSLGDGAFTDTLENLARASVVTAGAGATPEKSREPARLAQGGVRVAVVAMGRLSEKTRAVARDRVAIADPERLAAMVHAARVAADVVIVSLGGATEYRETPSDADVLLAHTAIEGGADVVIGHGARVPLGVGFVSGHPVLYGLGNLVADEDPKSPWTGRGFLAKVTFEAQGKPVVDLCPYLLVGGEPKLLAGPSRPTEEGIFKRALDRLSEPLGGVTTGEPDLHSCLRIAERGPAAAPGAPGATE